MRFFLSCLLIVFLSSKSKAAESVWKISEINGDISVISAQGKKWLPQEGIVLPTGAQLRSGHDGKAHLIHANSDLWLASDSSITLVGSSSSLGKVIDLSAGLLRVRFNPEPGSKLPSEFEVHTATVVAGVRGTEMGISTSPEQGDSVIILEGSGYAKNRQTNAIQELSMGSVFEQKKGIVRLASRTEFKTWSDRTTIDPDRRPQSNSEAKDKTRRETRDREDRHLKKHE